MAAAGFFHSNKRSDAVICFCCTLRLDDWNPHEDPITRHVEAAAHGRPCAWLNKIVAKPEQVTAPVPKRAAPMWDHRKIPRKCGECRKVFSSGNQYQKHKREAHPFMRRRAEPLRKPRPPINLLAASAVQKLKQEPVRLGGLFRGTHRVTKARSRVRISKRKRTSNVFPRD